MKHWKSTLRRLRCARRLRRPPRINDLITRCALPKSTPSWEDYLPGVIAYCSGQHPKLHSRAMLGLADHVVWDGTHVYSIDPAWPTKPKKGIYWSLILDAVCQGASRFDGVVAQTRLHPTKARIAINDLLQQGFLKILGGNATNY